MSHPHLKREALVIAGYLMPGELMTRQDDDDSLKKLVTRISAHRDCTITQLALIAVLLAGALDEQP